MAKWYWGRRLAQLERLADSIPSGPAGGAAHRQANELRALIDLHRVAGGEPPPQTTRQALAEEAERWLRFHQRGGK